MKYYISKKGFNLMNQVCYQKGLVSNIFFNWTTFEYRLLRQLQDDNLFFEKKCINKMQIRQHVNMWLYNLFQLSSLVFCCCCCPFWNWIPQKIGFHIIFIIFLFHDQLSHFCHIFWSLWIYTYFMRISMVFVYLKEWPWMINNF